MLATTLLEIVVNGVKLEVDILGGISKDSSKLFVRQRLMTIRYQNRFLRSFQLSAEMIQSFISHNDRTTSSETEWSWSLRW